MLTELSLPLHPYKQTKLKNRPKTDYAKTRVIDRVRNVSDD